VGVDFHINLPDRCPLADCMLLGYTNGYFDYVPTILAATQGGYGAGNSNTHVLVGAGERMLDHGLTHITKCWENLMRHYGSGLS
jgi:hypothetical protein